MRKIVISALAMCSLAVSVPADAQDRPRTTAELVQAALERNRDLLAARERLAEAQGLLRRAGVRPAPTIEIDIGSGRPVGTPGDREYSASYFHPIELGGKRGKRLDVGRTGVALAEADVADRTRALVFEVKVRIAEARAAQAKNEALERLLSAGRESLRLTQARVTEGDAAALEEQLLSTEIARVEAQRATFRGRAFAAVLDLRRSIGAATTESLVIAGDLAPLPKFSKSELINRALTTHPQMLAARAAEQEAEAALALARAEGVPDVTASVRYTRETTTFDDIFGLTSTGAVSPILDRGKMLTIGLSVPLFAPGRNRGAVDASVARANASRLRREYLEATLPQELEAAHERWVSAQETVSLFRRSVLEQSERNLVVMREAYTLGHMRLIDVLNEQRRLIDTQLAYIDAETELAQSAAGLERTVGVDLP